MLCNVTIASLPAAFDKALMKQEEKNGIVVHDNGMVSIFLSEDHSMDEAATETAKEENGDKDTGAGEESAGGGDDEEKTAEKDWGVQDEGKGGPKNV